MACPPTPLVWAPQRLSPSVAAQAQVSRPTGRVAGPASLWPREDEHLREKEEKGGPERKEGDTGRGAPGTHATPSPRLWAVLTSTTESPRASAAGPVQGSTRCCLRVFGVPGPV